MGSACRYGDWQQLVPVPLKPTAAELGWSTERHTARVQISESRMCTPANQTQVKAGNN